MMKRIILHALLLFTSATLICQTQNLNNSNLTNVNHITINDPGPLEGIGWLGTAANWSIDVSPFNRTNVDGNLNLYGTANSIVFWRPLKLYKTGPNQDNVNLISIAEDTNDHFWLQGMFAGTGSDGNSIRFKSAWNDNVLFMKGNGNIGIGTGSPSAKLHVSSMETGDTVLRIEADTDNNNEGDNSRIEIMQDGGLLGAYIGFNQDWGGTAADNLFRIGSRYSGIDYYNRLIIRTDNGHVGIGTATPSRELEVHGSDNVYAKISADATKNAALELSESGGQLWQIRNEGSTDDLKISNSQGTKMTLLESGSLGIGTTTPGEKLEVNGNALIDGELYSKKVKVSVNPGNWPDYVFAASYQLRALSEVEEFVKKNGHLPEVPSAKEVEKNGLDLGDMDATLMKKVEELTLYLIEIKKEIEVLKKENKRLSKEVKEVKK